jgi:hypothetical protein
LAVRRDAALFDLLHGYAPPGFGNPSHAFSSSGDRAALATRGID